MIRWWCNISICAFCVLSCFLGGVFNARAQSDHLEPNAEAEKLIVQLLGEGKVADLSLPFPDEADRVIGAEFLERLLAGKIISLDSDIAIRNVRIEGDFSLANQVLGNLSITQCIFAGDVNLQGSKFENLSLSSCTFLANADLQKLTVYDSADFTNSQFDRNTDFSFVDIGRNIDLHNTRFRYTETINFNSMNVGNSAFVTSAIFEGPVDFGYAQVSDVLVFDESHFNSASISSFNSLDVGDSVFFHNTTFAGSLDLGQSRIGASLDLSGASFNSEDRLLFNSMEISGSLLSKDAVFFGPVFFLYSKIGNLGDFSGTQFNSEDRLLFSSMEISGSLLFEKAVFSGPVFFLYSNIGNLGDFSGTQFNSPDIASFSFLNIRNGATFEDASFRGPVDFSHLDSEGSLNFQNAKFLGLDTTIRFADVNIRGDFQIKNVSFSGGLVVSNTAAQNSFVGDGVIFLDRSESLNIGRLETQSLALEFASFPGFVSFTNCSFENFSLVGSDPTLNFSFLNLSGTKAMQIFYIGDLIVQSFTATNLTSLGKAQIENVSINENLNLNFAVFNVLVFQNVNWPSTAGKLDLDGLSYNEIVPGESLTDKNWNELLDLINRSNYNNSLYRNLESYLGERGHSDWANQVFVAQKRRERSDLLRWYNLKWWWSQFLDGFILYGKQPGRAFLWSFLLIIIGSLVFRKAKMTADGKADESYNPFWYSLDLFIPYINLGVASKWHPKRGETKLLIYHRIHLILGWLVLPIALFAVSGLIK